MGDVAEKCKTALKLHQATDYKADFGFIDFVSTVKQKTLSDELDALAFTELALPMSASGWLLMTSRQAVWS